MLQVKSVTKEIVAVSWAPDEMFVRPHGKDQYGKELSLVRLSNDGTLIIKKKTADTMGINISIVSE